LYSRVACWPLSFVSIASLKSGRRGWAAAAGRPGKVARVDEETEHLFK
jgi:hypothetical protein